MPESYLPIMIFLVIAVAIGIGALLVGMLFRPRRSYPEKLSQYESGIPPVGEPRIRFSIKFFVVAMLFVVFDVEAIFLYPWAIVFDKIGMYAFIEMMIFIAILIVGYLYAWRKDAFKWE